MHVVLQCQGYCIKHVLAIFCMPNRCAVSDQFINNANLAFIVKKQPQLSLLTIDGRGTANY